MSTDIERNRPESIEEMRRSAFHRPFGEEPLPMLDSEATDSSAASGSFDDRRRLRRSDFVTLGWTTRHRGRIVPTVAVAFLDRHLATGLVVSGVRHQRVRPLPADAIREAIANAVVHAYHSTHGAPLRVAVLDDRVEIENPGVLPFGMTVDDMRSGTSRVRNRVLARTFRALGHIERWGTGILRMTDACRQMGLPDPGNEELAGRVRMTLSAVASRAPELNDVDRHILDLLDPPTV